MPPLYRLIYLLYTESQESAMMTGLLINPFEALPPMTTRELFKFEVNPTVFYAFLLFYGQCLRVDQEYALLPDLI